MKNFMKKVITMSVLAFAVYAISPNLLPTAYADGSPLYEKCKYERTQQDGIKCVENEYNKLVKKNPKDEKMYGEMIFIYLQAEQYDKAVNICNTGIKAVPNSYKLYNMLGTVQKDLGNTDKAIAAFTKSIEIEPTEPPYYNRARLYASIGEYDKAISDYSMAIKYSETNPDAYKERAIAKLTKGAYDKTLTDKDYSELAPSAFADFDMALKQYRETNNPKGYQEVIELVEGLNKAIKSK